MKRWLSVTLQILGGLGQTVNVFNPIMSERSKVVVAGSIGLVQLVVGTIAHNSNPDGTPAEAPWIPPNTR